MKTKNFGLVMGRWLSCSVAGTIGKFICCLFLASTLAVPSSVRAINASPEPVELKQPDGTRVTLRIRGDEFSNWFEDMDGFAVVHHQGEYVYAQLAAKGDLMPTQLAVGKANPLTAGLKRSLRPSAEVRQKRRAEFLQSDARSFSSPAQAISPNGSVKNLVILCKFSDHVFGTHTRPVTDYDILFNNNGPHPTLAPSGSVKDFYKEISYGTLTLDSAIVVWVTLPRTEAYYTSGNSGFNNYPTNAAGMVKDALDLVDPMVNFGQFDGDGNGFVDSIAVIHSGYGAETGGGGGNWMWSHKLTLSQLPGGQWTSADNNSSGVKVKVFDYHTEPALSGVTGTNIARIGVICHETGHYFGLPDLYDLDFSSEGVGSYCMMGNSWGFDGSQRNPPHPSAWCKVQLGWVTPTILKSNGVYSAPLVQTNKAIFKITNNFPAGEYLLVENRQPFGFESVMPQGGLAIWHIDETKPDNRLAGHPGQVNWPENGNHYKVALLQADGLYQLELGINRGDADDVYHGEGVSAIGRSTIPNTQSYQNGIVTPTFISIGNISPSGSIMSFAFSPGSGPPTIFSQPTSQSAIVGATVNFTVGAMGGEPFAYQWRKNDIDIPGATNSTCSFSNAQLASAGSYSVVVSNSLGSAISSNAVLTVNQLPQSAVFQILSLTTNNSLVAEHNAVTGNDRGGIAASSTQIFYSGDTNTARFSITNLSGGTSLGMIYDALVSDLQSSTVYSLGNGATPLSNQGGTVTTLLPHNGATGILSGPAIPLSTPIQSPANGGNVGIFAGYGRVVLHTGTRVYDILLPSGFVTDLGEMAAPVHALTENWAYWGVAEYFGGKLHLVYVRDPQSIVRLDVPDGNTTVLATFTNLSDMAAITVSPSRNRWYFHHQGNSQFGGTVETIGYANATFNVGAPCSNCPPVILTPPSSQTAAVGATANFQVLAIGSSPFSYQWRKNGTNIIGATNSAYGVFNVQTIHSGNYTVVVSNAFGLVTSSNATLTVPAGNTLFYASFESGLEGFVIDSTFGSSNGLWHVSTGRALDPGHSRNSSLYYGQNEGASGGGTYDNGVRNRGVVISPVINLPSSNGPIFLSFNYMISAEPSPGWDLAVVEISTNGSTYEAVASKNSLGDLTNDTGGLWVSSSVDISAFAGRDILVRFRFDTIDGVDNAFEGWYVDDISISQISTAPIIFAQPEDQSVITGATVAFTVNAAGAPPLNYQWRKNGTNIVGATNSTYNFSNAQTNDAGIYSVVVSNAVGSVVSSNAILSVVAQSWNILLFSDNAGANPYSSALTNLSLLHRYFGPNQEGAFLAAISAANLTNTLVIVDACVASHDFTSLIGFVGAGGRALLQYGNLDSAASLATAFHVSTVQDFTAPLSVWDWNASALFNGLSNPLAFPNNLFGDDGDKLEPLAGGQAVGGFVTNLTASQAAIVIGNSGRTIVNGFLLEEAIAGDAIKLAMNEILFLMGTTGSSPTISTQPSSQIVSVGSAVNLNVTASGTAPLTYQWRKDGTNIAGATASVYNIANAQTIHSGSYSVIVSNAFGSIASSNALLTVINPGQVNFAIGSVSGTAGTQVAVPVQVTGFSNLITFQFSMHWNPALLSLSGVQQFGLTGLTENNFGTNLSSSGTATVSWDDATIQGVNAGNGTIAFALLFNLAGPTGTVASVTIDGNPTPVEAANAEFLPAIVSSTPGQVTILSQVNIAGAIAYSTGQAIPEVILDLSGSETQQTNVNGSYNFTVTAGGNYIITPGKSGDSNPGQGVTTLDITLLRRHVLGIAALDSPLKIISADVNDSQSVSTLDITLMRRVILGITNNFPAGLWKFAPSDFVFTNSLNPWPFAGARNYSGISANMTGQNFVGMKMGDVNNSWTNGQSSFVSAAGDLASVGFAASSETVVSGNPVSVPIVLSDFTNVTSAQFTLQWDPLVLQFQSVSNFGLSGLDIGNFNTGLASAGKLMCSWDAQTGVGLSRTNDTVMFAIQFVAVGTNGSNSSIAFVDVPTAREVSASATLAAFESHSGMVEITEPARPRIQSVNISGETMSLVWSAIPQRVYRVEYKSDLNQTNWIALNGDVTAIGNFGEKSDAVSGEKRFYRIILLQ